MTDATVDFSPFRPALPDVTLVAITSVAIPATLRALRLSQQQCQFAATLFLSDQDPAASGLAADLMPALEWRPIAPIRSHREYSRFMLSQLGPHIATSHALCVQWDGYVLQSGAWDPAFLAYDYIGAPWPHFSDGMVVGNGGFSLRSRRLLDATRRLVDVSGEPEDITICRTHRRLLEQQADIRFAPLELARRFAFERHERQGNEFGFHGVFNLVDLIERAEFKSIIAALEAPVMAASERRELLRWACRRFDPGLIMMILRRMLRSRPRPNPMACPNPEH